MTPPLNRATLLLNGDQILPALLADVRAARSSIHVSVFLWFHDPIGDEFADVLIARARDGVAVRVLLNIQKTGMGDPFSTGEKEMMAHDPAVKHDPLDVRLLCRRMRDAGIEVVDTNIDYDKVNAAHDPRLSSIAAQIRETIEIDDLHIDHRKIIAVDGRIGYCGGANIGAQYMFHVPFDPQKDARDEGEERKQAGLPEPWWKWHDSLTRFEGPLVGELERHFHDRFVLDGGRDYTSSPPAFTDARPSSTHARAAFQIASAEVFGNEPNDQPNAVRELYVRLIGEARHSIFIENPYLYHPSIVDALCEAKRQRQELDVTLVLPAGKWNDNSFAHDAQQHEYARYLQHGIALYEYQHHFNHLKIAVFDERWSIHGSANGNFRSLENDKDFELVVLVDDEPFARDILARVRDVDVRHARPITSADLDGSIAGFRIRHRDPRTLLLLSRREL
jgi:cardiolipin synthase